MYGSLTTAGLFPETGFQMFFALHFHPVAGFSPLPPVLTSSGACLLSPGGGCSWHRAGSGTRARGAGGMGSPVGHVRALAGLRQEALVCRGNASG